MTMRTQNPKIFDAIVVSISMYMVKFKWNSTILRLFCPTAFFAHRQFYLFNEQTLLELEALEIVVFYKNV